MSFFRLFLVVALFLFGAIAVGVLAKTAKKDASVQSQLQVAPSQPQPSQSQAVDISLLTPTAPSGSDPASVRAASAMQSLPRFDDDSVEMEADQAETGLIIDHGDEDDSMRELFEKPARCPIVETIRYSSRVDWKPKKSAWLVDYAKFHKTPLEFMYRSINKPIAASGGARVEYSEAPAVVGEGAELNVFRSDIQFHFYLVVSFASSRLRLYYILPNEKKAVFLKSYPVCLGRVSSEKSSGSLTPFGVYQLGQRVASFKPNMTGPYKGKTVELVQVFGTRWIPFERAVDQALCTEPAKGFGIHGTPMRRLPDNQLAEDNSSIGKYESDGCIRLSKKDVEELYSVISARRSYIEIVPDFGKSRLMQGKI